MCVGRILPIGCGCRTCKWCAPVVARRHVERLVERYKLQRVQSVGFVTLTIAAGRFGAGREGWEHLKDFRLVGESMRKLGRIVGSRVPLMYHAIKQFHPSGSGNLHVHVLVDGLGFLTMKRLKRFQTWCQLHLGTMDYKFRGTREAVEYASRYVKRAQEFIPDWVRGEDGLDFRWSSSSKGFWPEVMRGPKRGVDVVDWRAFEVSSDEPRYRGHVCYGGVPECVHREMDKDVKARCEPVRRRTMWERESECGSKCIVVAPVEGGGFRYLGTLPWRYKNLAALGVEGFIEAVEVEGDYKPYWEFWMDTDQLDAAVSYCEWMATIVDYEAPATAGPQGPGPSVRLSLEGSSRSVEHQNLLSPGWVSRRASW